MKMVDADKSRMIGLPYGEKNYDSTLSRFHLIPERHGQTDGRTDIQNCYINIARQVSTQYVESIYRPKYYTVTLKSGLEVTQGH